MDFIVAGRTDIGNVKKKNQDAILMQVADTDRGQVLFAAVCDGMGGLDSGEIASAVVLRALSDWFTGRFAKHILYSKDLSPEVLRDELCALAREENNRIVSYGRDQNPVKRLGTTATVLLIMEGRYFIMNIGDSRCYRISRNSVRQLTKDQTFVQHEIDYGRMTPEEALHDSRRHVLLQCIGASDEVYPDFYAGDARTGDQFLICSDGYRHKISESEMMENLSQAKDADEMGLALEQTISLNKERGEQDNISAILVRVSGGLDA